MHAVYEVVHHGYEDEEQECSTEDKKERRLTNVRNQFSTDRFWNNLVGLQAGVWTVGRSRPATLARNQ